MLSIDDRTRTRCRRVSFTLCSISLILFPIVARSAIEPSSRTVPSDPFPIPKLTAPNIATIRVTRDPFVALRGSTSAAVSNSPPSVQGSAIVGRTVVQGSPIGYALPPNAGASAMMASGAANEPVVRALVLGDRPRALIEDAGTVRVISPNDAIAGTRVRAIDASGVHLHNGSTLVLREDTR